MSNLKFKVGDHVRITNYDGKVENCATSFIESMIGNVYIINSIEGRYYRINSELFTDDELELVETKLDELVPVSKILVVNKIRPEYSNYIECTKEAIEEFFLGTRIFDFYVIKDGKLLELKKTEDVIALYEDKKNSNFREQLFAMTGCLHTVELDGIKFTRGIFDSGATYLYHSRADNYTMDLYIKSKHSNNAWYTLEEFASMVEDGTYEIKE